MPLTFPAHQGLILPVARKWPNRFDTLALAVGAAMPDVIDSLLGFTINGYFKQWYGHSLIGLIAFDIPAGLLITWLVRAVAARLSKSERSVTGNTDRRVNISLWVFSVTVGILSHLGFDLISHDTNLLLYPWHENVRWLPEWWYTTWFEVRIPLMFGHSYSFGLFSISWGILSVIGVFLFYRFFMPKSKVTRLNDPSQPIDSQEQQSPH